MNRNTIALFHLSIAFFFIEINYALAEVYFSSIWGRSGTIVLNSSPIQTSVWQLESTDTDENTKGTGLQTTPIGFLSIHLSDSPFGGVDVSTLGGEFISKLPHDLDQGTWAYGMGFTEFLDGDGIDAYFQMRLSGSQATVQDTTLAQSAVAAGLWPSVNAYIEFEPGFAWYSANTPTPSGPADYQGLAFPEPSSIAMMLIGLFSMNLLWHR